MKRIIFVLFLVTTSAPLYSQYINVRITPSPSVTFGEEYIIINPKNPDQVVVGSIGYYTPQNTLMGYFFSTNGGLNWSGGPLLTTLAQPGSDPVVEVDTNGNFYYITCANWLVPPPPWLDKLLCLKSTNGGMNWSNGTAFAQLAPKMDDMPMACVDFSHSPYGNNIYVTWSLYDHYTSTNPNDSSYVYFCRSTDGGNTFSTPLRVSKIAGTASGDNSSPEGPEPCTGPNGEVYVCFTHSEQIFFNRSTNAGVTWLENDILVTQQVGGWLQNNFSPVSDCDISNSPYSGNIYICFADQKNGVNDRDIWVTRSTNGGFNWNTPVRVNDDPPGNDQRMPWICVDRVTGYIWVVFYDTRGQISTQANVYVARSTDGGSTFQNAKVSEQTTTTVNWLGDYIGISAYNNKVRPVWSKSISTDYCELWTAIMDTFIIGIKPISTIVPDKYALHQNYPNPFNPTTKIIFDIPLSRGVPATNGQGVSVKLTIYDLLGREITTLVKQQLHSGMYEVEWDGTNYASGMYFYKLISGEPSSSSGQVFSETKRMVLMK
jgi:hypothetical protein